MPVLHAIAALILVALGSDPAEKSPRELVPAPVHLRKNDPREWDSFPEQPAGRRLETTFTAAPNSGEFTLLVRQQDVKQVWLVSLNGDRLGQLTQDENDLRVAFRIPAKALREGDNRLTIEQQGDEPDDVRVGEITLTPRSRDEVLNECRIAIDVVDAETGSPLPCRLTIIDEAGSLPTLGAESNGEIAVRNGTVFAATGHASFGIPAGRYTVFAGRGFEYSLASSRLAVEPGDERSVPLAIRREVSTPGYVACDPHVHTLTHSGHGDATAMERMITLACEGIELPVATDHNVLVDAGPDALASGVARYLTPVIGDEVTTAIGHFNVFPLGADAQPPAHELTTWPRIFEEIYRTSGAKVAILNHARDVHQGMRPFHPKRFNAAVGETAAGWDMTFNAMEVINSSATRTDVLQLFHDWMAILNSGRLITPVGASDSHDVLRHFVGQARTYIRCDDRDAGRIDRDEAILNFVQGRVMVSYGLLPELVINGKYASGELATAPDETLTLRARVLGPAWTTVDRVGLYVNGRLEREEAVAELRSPDLPVGVKWEKEWSLSRPAHDVHVVLMAVGPGIDAPWWRTAKPYQWTSAHWEPHVAGCSGAVRIDADHDGRWMSARDYATRLLAETAGNFPTLVKRLEDFDASVAAQAAFLCHQSGMDLTSADVRAALRDAAPSVQEGFAAWGDAWREGEMLRSTPE